MIALIQRVSEAQVVVAGDVIGAIGAGMLVLLGVERNDTPDTSERLAARLSKYRIFNDEQGKMNLNIQQVGGEMLIVSQFTLVADTQKGNRPGFSRGASPEQGEALYLQFINDCQALGIEVQSGQFGADMQVSLTNDGPVTFQLQVN